MTYTPVTVTNYNATPPSDDGTQSAANRASWSTVKTKLFDPLKTALEAMNSAIDDEVDVIEANFFTSGTTMLFAQDATPTGWSKSTDTDFSDVGLRVVTGTPGSGGSLAFSAAFTDRTFAVAQGNLPSVNFTHSLTAANHYHGPGSLVVPTHYNQSGTADISTNGGGETFLRNYGQGNTSTGAVYSVSQWLSGATAASGAVAITGDVPTGGSGTEVSLSFAVKYQDLIVGIMN